jgi:hypothetical protein
LNYKSCIVLVCSMGYFSSSLPFTCWINAISIINKVCSTCYRKDLTDAGAINIGTNVKVNGTWFSLGTSGIANNLSLAGDKFIGTYTNTKVEEVLVIL